MRERAFASASFTTFLLPSKWLAAKVRRALRRLKERPLAPKGGRIIEQFALSSLPHSSWVVPFRHRTARGRRRRREILDFEGRGEGGGRLRSSVSTTTTTTTIAVINIALIRPFLARNVGKNMPLQLGGKSSPHLHPT